jgi:DNA repair ATPase RecN
MRMIQNNRNASGQHHIGYHPLDSIQSSLNSIQSDLNNRQSPFNNIQNLLNSIQCHLDNIQSRLDTIQSYLNNIQSRLNSIHCLLDSIQSHLDSIQCSLNSYTKLSCIFTMKKVTSKLYSLLLGKWLYLQTMWIAGAFLSSFDIADAMPNIR